MPSFACRRRGEPATERLLSSDDAKQALGAFGWAQSVDNDEALFVEIRSLDVTRWTPHRIQRATVRRRGIVVATMLVTEQLGESVMEIG